jgi:hypothetical protein
MSDNVVKFRRIEKKPEKPPEKKKPGVPGWLPWFVLVIVACAIYGAQQSGILARLFG